MSDSKTQAYEVTATKRRPKTFDELAGQEFVVSTLKNSLESGKIAHAYLFSGPRGCGKTSAARILARSLNCEKANKAGYTGNPCGECDNCRAISQGASVDVLEIDGASNTGINDVKRIQEEILFPPQTGPYKVYIIDEVHMLSNSAFNALLKTIEEPPPYIIFIFATTELHKVPATIKSRCQQFNFRLIPIETIQEILKRVCAESGIKYEDGALFWIARESTGSLRDAYTLFDQVVSFSDGFIREDVIREKLGLVGIENLNILAEACAANNVQKAFAVVDEVTGSGIAIEQFIIDLAGYYRSLLLLKNGITRESLLGYRVNLFSEKVLGRYDNIRFEHALEILLDCYRNIRYSVSPRFELEAAVSKLTWLSEWAPPPELAAAIKSARTILTGQGISGTVISPDKNTPPRNAAESPAVAAAPATGTSSASAYPGKGTRSLTDDFKRVIAARSGAGNAADTAQADNDNADDIPVWSNIAHANTDAEGKANSGSPGDSPDGVSAESPVDKILRIIPGTEVSSELPVQGSGL
ncbi:MAG: DNA polymerase III subunit gamma/tau [Treponema sp.]|nr:DNA polymerase III subunit gamma/tau [Treponema sp.]